MEYFLIFNVLGSVFNKYIALLLASIGRNILIQRDFHSYLEKHNQVRKIILSIYCILLSTV